MEPNFSVQIEDFALTHYVKSFEKKYRNNWDITLRAIIETFERIDALLNTSKAEIICSCYNNLRFIKTEFRVFGTKESAKTSGNRCIIAVNFEKKEVRVILVYGKTDLGGHNETFAWKEMVRNNYPEFKYVFK